MGLQDVSKIFKSSGYCSLVHKNANNRKAGVNLSIRLHSVDTLQIDVHLFRKTRKLLSS